MCVTILRVLIIIGTAPDGRHSGDDGFHVGRCSQGRVWLPFLVLGAVHVVGYAPDDEIALVPVALNGVQYGPEFTIIPYDAIALGEVQTDAVVTCNEFAGADRPITQAGFVVNIHAFRPWGTGVLHLNSKDIHIILAEWVTCTVQYFKHVMGRMKRTRIHVGPRMLQELVHVRPNTFWHAYKPRAFQS